MSKQIDLFDKKMDEDEFRLLGHKETRRRVSWEELKEYWKSFVNE